MESRKEQNISASLKRSTNRFAMLETINEQFELFEETFNLHDDHDIVVENEIMRVENRGQLQLE